MKFTKPKLRSNFWFPLVNTCLFGMMFLLSWYRHRDEIWHGMLFVLSAAVAVLALFVEPRSREQKSEIQSLHLGPNKGDDFSSKFK